MLENANYNIIGVYLGNTVSKGLFTYGYYQTIINDFSTYSNLDVIEIPLQQFIGFNKNIFEDILFVNGKRNPKLDIVKIPIIKAIRRPIEEIRREINEENEIKYFMYDGKEEIQITEFNPLVLYSIYEKDKDNKLKYCGDFSFKIDYNRKRECERSGFYINYYSNFDPCFLQAFGCFFGQNKIFYNWKRLWF